MKHKGNYGETIVKNYLKSIGMKIEEYEGANGPWDFKANGKTYELKSCFLPDKIRAGQIRTEYNYDYLMIAVIRNDKVSLYRIPKKIEEEWKETGIIRRNHGERNDLWEFCRTNRASEKYIGPYLWKTFKH